MSSRKRRIVPPSWRLTEDQIAEFLMILGNAGSSREQREIAEMKLEMADALPEGYERLEPRPDDLSATSEYIAGASTVRRVGQAKPGLEHIPPWGEMEVTRGSDVEHEDILWLWRNRLPQGKLSLIAGDQGLGKSQLSLALAAHVTKGKPWPDADGEPTPKGSCIFLTCEDDLADTIAPRAAAAGCDLKKLYFSTTIRQRDGSVSPFSISRDIPPLEDTLKKVGDARMLVIDPILDFMMGVKENEGADIRHMLRPLRDVAKKWSVAVLIIHHLNKGSGLKALYRVANAGALTQVARMCWLLSEHPFDSGRRVLVPLKENLAARQPGVLIRLGEKRVHLESDPVEWDADDVMRLLHEEKYREEREDGEGRRGPRGKMKEAITFIEKKLAKKPVPPDDLRREAKAAGYTDRVYYKALGRLMKDLDRVEKVSTPEQPELLQLKAPSAQRELPFANGAPRDPSTN